MTKIFAVLSGEHPTLPLSEIKAVLEAENIDFKILEVQPCLVRFEASMDALEKIGLRAAYCRICGIELFECNVSREEVLKFASEINYEKFANPGETFAVRVKRICGAEKLSESLELERKLGEAIWTKVKGLKVNLKSPKKLFVGLITKNRRFIFGLSRSGFIRRNFSARTPSKKPFFHPSSLTPKLARCMVNLSRVSIGKLLYDPFCGTGTILIEAGLMGFKAVGSDIQRKMVVGARVNLKHYHVDSAGVLIADALNPPVKKVNAIATDPPYGRVATTAGRAVNQLLEGFLEASREILLPNSHICSASPLKADLPSIGEKLGFKILEEHQVYVHKSLTRRIVIFRFGG
jgi:tRNA (guanine10-N2)-dimethyltransferase